MNSLTIRNWFEYVYFGLAFDMPGRSLLTSSNWFQLSLSGLHSGKAVVKFFPRLDRICHGQTCSNLRKNLISSTSYQLPPRLRLHGLWKNTEKAKANHFMLTFPDRISSPGSFKKFKSYVRTIDLSSWANPCLKCFNGVHMNDYHGRVDRILFASFSLASITLACDTVPIVRREC